jgi:hypothetical protein
VGEVVVLCGGDIVLVVAPYAGHVEELPVSVLGLVVPAYPEAALGSVAALDVVDTGVGGKAR